MNIKLIGIHGKAGAGKDTVADYLHSRYGFVKYSFASPIKEGLKKMLGLSDEDFDDREKKEARHPVYGVSPRRMMQTLGTEWGRNLIGPDVWLKRADVFLEQERKYWEILMIENYPFTDVLSGYTPDLKIVIPDVRFEGEAAWVRSKGGVVWHLFRPGVESVEGHVSEQGIQLDMAGGDCILSNTSSIEVLHERIDLGMKVFL